MKRSPHSFTLLEVMVVVTLLGLIAGYVFRGVFDTAESPTHLLRRLASIDAEARLMARQYGPVSMKIEQDKQGSATAVILASDESERRYEIRASIKVAGSKEDIAQIGFDRHGQSEDYQATIDEDPHVLYVSGLTGWTWINNE